jgi:alpha-methylacyl-CoA racemase
VTGPLSGLRVVELANLGPVPFCGMVLADMGADVVRVDRADGSAGPVPGPTADDVLNRGRRSIAVDLRHPDGAGLIRRLAAQADVLVEGFRPGVAERLGFGPDECRRLNRRLVYARMTGWGRSGPMAHRAGHDINFVGLSGALAAIGRSGQAPTPPLNLIADYGGGGLLLAYGIVCAIVERATSGVGQIVDTAMVDGATLLMAPFFALRDLGAWTRDRGANLLDSGAPFYEVYATSDGNWLAVGAIEPQFYAALLRGLELDEPVDAQFERDRWPEVKARIASRVSERTLDEWLDVFDGVDACVSAVLSLDEVPTHPQHVARQSFVALDGLRQPAATPRFDRTPPGVPRPAARPGQHTREVLGELGLGAQEIDDLVRAGVVHARG